MEAPVISRMALMLAPPLPMTRAIACEPTVRVADRRRDSSDYKYFRN